VEKVLSDLRVLSKARYVPANDFALAYLGLGDRDHALEWFQRAYEDRSLRPDFMKDPEFDELRSDSRFQDLLRRAGLPP
jgi:hypothetical protein